MSTTTKEHEIELTDWEAAAIAGDRRCSQLRRVIDPQPPNNYKAIVPDSLTRDDGRVMFMNLDGPGVWFTPGCPFGVPGDRLVMPSVRLTGIIANVRVQRAKEISEADLKAIGLQMDIDREADIDPWDVYADQFNIDHGPDVWERNPWQWVLDFERNDA